MNRLESAVRPLEQREQVERYVAENIIPLRLSLRTCADGRYNHGKGDGGRMASFGADVGKAFALLPFGISPKDAVDLVLQAVTTMKTYKKNPSFYMHTEMKPDWWSLKNLGCGHAKTLHESSEEEIEEIFDYLDYLHKEGYPIEVIPLQGEHLEEAKLINEGLSQTVRPNDGRRMFFVHDEQAEHQFVSKVLFPSFREQGLSSDQVDEFDYLALLDLQTQQTTNRLTPNLPVYRINADEHPPFVF